MLTLTEFQASPVIQAARQKTREADCAVSNKERDQRAERIVRTLKRPHPVLDHAQETRRIWEIGVMRKRLAVARAMEDLAVYEASLQKAREAEAMAMKTYQPKKL